MPDARLPLHGRGRHRIVAREHGHPDTESLQIGHGLRAAGLDHIRHGNDAEHSVSGRKKQRRLAFGREGLRPVAQGFRQGKAPCLQQTGVTRQTLSAVQTAANTLPGRLGEGSHLRRRKIAPFGLPDNGPAQRMFRQPLQRRGHAKQLRRVHAVCRKHVACFRRAAGDGPGLVQHHGRDALHGLHGFRGFEENPAGGAPSCPHHDGRGRRQPQRAGAGNDQHGNGNGKRKFQILAKQQPDAGGQNGNGDDYRYKNAAYSVCQAGNGRL